MTTCAVPPRYLLLGFGFGCLFNFFFKYKTLTEKSEFSKYDHSRSNFNGCSMKKGKLEQKCC